MTLQELMNIDVNNLAKAQHDALKKHVLKTLEDACGMIRNEQYELFYDLLCFSPSGDVYGKDNYYINFDYENDKVDSEGLDIADMLDHLIKLKSMK